MGYTFVDNLTYADIAFRAWGITLNELFESAARATSESMADLSTIRPRTTQTYEYSSEDVDDLLFNFLSYIVLVKDRDALIFSSYRITVTKKRKYFLKAACSGEPIDPSRHTLHNDVKAVTYHTFRVEHTKDGYATQVILDV